MKILKFKDREPWLNARLGKATGSRAKDILPGRNGETKKGRWELVAERLIGSAALNDDENPMARGNRLESEALERFRKETGKKVDSSLLMWLRDDDESIALSPDGVIGKTAAVEVKCLNAASHIEARVTGKIPKNTAGYDEQAIQYFVVNESLKKLYFVFYDPRFPAGLDFFYLTLTRKEKQEQIASQLAEIRDALKWVRDTVNNLTLYSPEDIQAMQQVHEELTSQHSSDMDRVQEVMKGVRKPELDAVYSSVKKCS